MVIIQLNQRREEERRERARQQNEAKRHQREVERKAKENRGAIIKEYGKSQPGKLVHDELRRLFADLTGGKAIQNSDVDYYLKRFGKQNDESVTYFLPTTLEGEVVLVPEGVNRYRVGNIELQSRNAILGYHPSKDLDTKVYGISGPKVGDVIEGVDDGDGWVRVRLFLNVITLKELKCVLNSFSRYATVMDASAEVLAKYDATHKGALSRAEVKQLMVDVNSGQDVTDEEVDRVMMHADMTQTGQVEAPEVNEAIVWWHGQVQKQGHCGCFQQ